MDLRQILLIVTTFTFGACDYVDRPLDTDGGGGNGQPGNIPRKVLLEDVTGHLCNNCPQAAITAQQLHNVYGDDLVIVGVHATDAFATPLAGGPGDPYTTDFRTPAGNAYEQTFGVNFLPTGLISRRLINSTYTIAHTAWGSAVADVIGEDADVEIWFDVLNYDPGTRVLNAVVKLRLINDLSGDHNCITYLTEDHVIDWQLDASANPANVPDYDHRHVLRDNPNGTWGVQVIAGSASAGDTITVNLQNYTVNSAWSAANCALVAYIYDVSTYEVLQVGEKKLIP